MSTRTNNSVIRAFRILEVLSASPTRKLFLPAIAKQAKLSPATTHRFLLTLEHVGAVSASAQGGYFIGKRLDREASAVGSDPDSAAVLRVHVDRLVEMVRETVHVAVLDAQMARYVAKGESDRSQKIVTRVNTRLEAYCTGVGKVLLAALSPDQLSDYLCSAPFVALTTKTLTSAAALRRELRQVRDRGFAIDDEEFEDGLRCIAVPILDHADRVIAALSISGASSRLNDVQVQAYVSLAMKASRRIATGLLALPPGDNGSY